MNMFVFGDGVCGVGDVRKDAQRVMPISSSVQNAFLKVSANTLQDHSMILSQDKSTIGSYQTSARLAHRPSRPDIYLRI